MIWQSIESKLKSSENWLKQKLECKLNWNQFQVNGNLWNTNWNLDKSIDPKQFRHLVPQKFYSGKRLQKLLEGGPDTNQDPTLLMHSCQPHDEHTPPHTGPAERPTAPSQQQRLGLEPKSEEKRPTSKISVPRLSTNCLQTWRRWLAWLLQLPKLKADLSMGPRLSYSRSPETDNLKPEMQAAEN